MKPRIRTLALMAAATLSLALNACLGGDAVQPESKPALLPMSRETRPSSIPDGDGGIWKPISPEEAGATGLTKAAATAPTWCAGQECYFCGDTQSCGIYRKRYRGTRQWRDGACFCVADPLAYNCECR